LHGQRAIALTDHGTLGGAIQFIKACREENIKPILGSEFYCSRNRRAKSKKEQPEGKRGNRHLNLFAKNLTGYKNLCTLSQRSYLEGYYYSPRIDFELLQEFSKGLICSSACLSNVINWNLSIDRYDLAKKAATILKDIFKKDFYLEMMYHGMDTQSKILPLIKKLSVELDIKTIPTFDSHYTNKEDAKYQEIVECISQKRCYKDPDRYHFPYQEFYIKSTEEVCKVFGHLPQTIKNTQEIVDKCDLDDLKFGGMLLPKFDVPIGFESDYNYLAHLAWDGLKKKGKDKDPRYVERLTLELSDTKLVWITKKLDFKAYFLIVWDFCNFMKKEKIPYDVRGSGNGSLLLWCLGITNIDSVLYGLSWPRFLGFDSVKYICLDDIGL